MRCPSNGAKSQVHKSHVSKKCPKPDNCRNSQVQNLKNFEKNGNFSQPSKRKDNFSQGAIYMSRISQLSKTGC